MQDGSAEIRYASDLWGKNAIEVQEILKGELGSSVKVAASGVSGDNQVVFANVIADYDSSASSGFGAVIGSKNLKAIAVRGNGKVTAADPERHRELVKYLRELKKIFVWHEIVTPNTKRKACFGCINGCLRGVYMAKDGRKWKSVCHAPIFYQPRTEKYYGGPNDIHFYAGHLCDEYGLDTMVLEPLIDWLSRCYEAGVLSNENTGLPLSKIGSMEFIQSLVKKISLREGFGDILAQGIYGAADSVGGRAKELIHDVFSGKEVTMYASYDPRTYITTGLLYAMDARRPAQLLHEISIILMRWFAWVNKTDHGYVTSDIIREVAKCNGAIKIRTKS